MILSADRQFFSFKLVVFTVLLYQDINFLDINNRKRERQREMTIYLSILFFNYLKLKFGLKKESEFFFINSTFLDYPLKSSVHAEKSHSIYFLRKFFVHHRFLLHISMTIFFQTIVRISSKDGNFSNSFMYVENGRITYENKKTMLCEVWSKII